MESEHKLRLIGLSLTVILLLSSCHTTGVRRVAHRGPGIGHGPPAHAPAHGHRRKQVCGYDLIYDHSCGLYVVVGFSDHYYHDGYFYRLHGDVWQVSLRATDWRPVAHEALPSALKVKVKPVVTPGGKVNAVVKATGPTNAVIKSSGPNNAVIKTAGNADAPGNSNASGKGKAKGHAKGKK